MGHVRKNVTISLTPWNSSACEDREREESVGNVE